jgi:hypothetical protein
MICPVRIDAIFEHETSNGIREETVEWKTYAARRCQRLTRSRQ